MTDDVIDDAGNQGVELDYTREMSKCLLDDTTIGSDDHAVIQIYKAGPSHAVIQRDTDLQTNEDQAEQTRSRSGDSRITSHMGEARDICTCHTHARHERHDKPFRSQMGGHSCY